MRRESSTHIGTTSSSSCCFYSTCSSRRLQLSVVFFSAVVTYDVIKCYNITITLMRHTVINTVRLRDYYFASTIKFPNSVRSFRKLISKYEGISIVRFRKDIPLKVAWSSIHTQINCSYTVTLAYEAYPCAREFYLIYLQSAALYSYLDEFF